MDQSLTSLNQLMKPKVVKKITQLILSAYVFSFFFSYSSWISFLLKYSFKFPLYTFPLQLVSHTIDRKCIFLICNGILVFLASNSGLFSSSSSPSESYLIDEFPSDTLSSSSETRQQDVPLVEKEELVVESYNGSLELVVAEEEENIQDKFIIYEGEEEEIEDKLLMIKEDGEKEELNKKFDDFIKRMKEGFRIEAQQQQQQLVLVN